jgi:hypothetical protein
VTKRFSKKVVAERADAKILGVRAGKQHRFTGVCRSERLRHAVREAYAEKYPTKGSQRWVRGFAEPAREATTLELLPP